MPDYSIIFKPSAQKELKLLPVETSTRIFAKIMALASEPRPVGCLKLNAAENGWRIRIGDYRVIYTIDDDTRTVEISRVRHRRHVYD